MGRKSQEVIDAEPFHPVLGMTSPVSASTAPGVLDVKSRSLGVEDKMPPFTPVTCPVPGLEG